MKHFNQHAFRDGFIERDVHAADGGAGCVRAKGGWGDQFAF